MDLPHLHRVRYMARRYTRLHGLRLLPLAAPFLISAVWRIGAFGPYLPGGPRAAAIWFVAALAGAVILSFAIRAWYTNTFGFSSQPMLHSGVLPLSALAIGFVIAVWLQEQWHWPLSVPAVFVAAVLLGIGVSHRAARKHYIAAAFVWLAVVALGTFGLSDATRDAALDLAIALVLIIAGVGDHRLLLRNLHRPTAA